MSLRHPLSLARFLYAQRVVGLNPPTAIGLDEEARADFLNLLKTSKGYLEFGSGGSTAEAARLGIRTLSVEADRYFADAVRRSLPEGAPVEVLHIDIGVTREWSRPIFTAPIASRLARWRRYSSEPFERLEELGWFPDLVLVDARFRRACALETARRTLEADRRLSLFVDDYADQWRGYAAVERWLGAPKRIGRAALFDVSKSTIMRVPSEAEIDTAARDYG
jgi:hypothetical protein